MDGYLPAIKTALVLLLLASFGIDFNNMAHGGAIDLRNRVTGIRLLEHGIDPYFYKWDILQPPEYCDPYNNPAMKVSKTTATPALLMLHLFLAPLPYRLAEISWFLLQWILLLATVWLWLRFCETPRQRWLLIAFVTAFTYTASWRLHAERGQSYVLLLFLFAVWLMATRSANWGNHIVTGLVAGFVATLRPPFALLIPFLALHRRGQLAGAGIGALLGLGLPLPMSASCWSDYYSAMQTYSDYYRAHSEPSPPQREFPPRIEGVPTDILANYVSIPYADFSMHAFLRWLGALSFPAEPVELALVAPFGLWLWLSRGERAEKLLAGMAAWLFLADFFLPAYRNSYVDVLIINLAGLGLISSAKFPVELWPCLPALPVGWAVYLLAVPSTPAWIINLPAFLFTTGAIFFLFFSSISVKPARASAAIRERK
ncbi:MAG TPA: glycosyltransferase 87 family protein [Candidatus Methylacidiphilales bacterium]|nr:glycosyltransferase 87 family protein [Candidatus Methylacidiphilales bacterium]